MPKKIDYVIVAPVSNQQGDGTETAEEEASRPSRGPRGRGPSRGGPRPPGGAARPSTGYRGPGGGGSGGFRRPPGGRSEEHTSELQSRRELVCRPLLEKEK